MQQSEKMRGSVMSVNEHYKQTQRPHSEYHFSRGEKKYHKKTNKPKAYGLRESDLEACLVFAS